MTYGFKSPKRSQGQASTEYLLTASVVLMALSGIAVLFSDQVNGYISLLYRTLTLPF